MHSISFGAEGDNIMEVVSVKVLLKQVYSAHLAKVRSLENELREVKEKLLESSKSDKAECSQCKEMQKTLDCWKQEHTAALQEQRKKFECLAQKLVLLENRNPSSSVNPSAKQDSVKKSPKLQSESSQRKQILKSINTNICAPEVKCMDKKPNQTERVKSGSKNSYSTTETGKGFHPFCAEPLANKASIPSANQKKLLEESFMNDSNNDFDVVLVAETLDLLDEVSNKGSDKRLTEKESVGMKGGSPKTSLNVDVGKENVLEGTKSSSSEQSISAKRRGTGNSKDDEQIIKKCKSVSSKETATSVNDKTLRDTNLPTTVPSHVDVSSIDTSVNRDDINNENNLDDSSNFIVNSSFFELDSTFSEQKTQSVSNNDKKSKIITNPIEILHHDDDADFQTSIGSVLKKENDVGSWKTSKKNPKKSSSIKNIKTTSCFKMTLSSPRLNFRKPKYKQTKLSKSIFHPSNASTTDDVILLEKVDRSDSEDGVSSNKSNKSDAKEGKNSCKATQKDGGTDEILTWDGGTLSNSEIEKLKNMTIDMDATFVPDLLMQSSNDSVSDVPGVPNTTKGSQEQDADDVNICDKDKNKSSEFKDGTGGQRELLETSGSCSNQRHNSYLVEQYPKKDVHKSPLSRTTRQKYNSFDKIPSPEKPSYKFKEDPVRNRDKRQQLKGFDCKECEKYYSALGLSDKEKRERLKQCSRHRATYAPPATPEHFWELEFPDTQECKARGYLGDTQKVALKSRRRRPLK